MAEVDKQLDYFQVACAAIAIYNSVEVLGLAGTTFKKYKTLYFWAICGCAAGCILFAGGFLDLFYDLYIADGVTIYRPLFILTFGWYGMVTGFALVLWSRLHVVNVPKKYIRWCKYFIIYNCIFSHLPTTVMTFGANVTNEKSWIDAYAVMEKLQMTMFCIQEVTMGAMYLHYTRKLRLSKKVTSLVRQTLYINSVVLALDISMLICEYVGLYNYQIMLKVAVYSIKLKLEFFILNLLTKFLTSEGQDSHTSKNQGHFSSQGGAHNGKEIAPATMGDDEVPRKTEAVQSKSESQSATTRGEA